MTPRPSGMSASDWNGVGHQIRSPAEPGRSSAATPTAKFLARRFTIGLSGSLLRNVRAGGNACGLDDHGESVRKTPVDCRAPCRSKGVLRLLKVDVDSGIGKAIRSS